MVIGYRQPIVLQRMERIIATPRLELRRLHAGDLDALHEMYSDPLTMRYVGAGMPATREQSAEALLSAITQYEQYGFGLMATIHAESQRMIGRCGYKLWQIEGKDCLEIGWMTHRDYLGEGYATEAGIGLREHAFHVLGWDEVISVIQPGNLASIRVAQKVGEHYWKDWTTPGAVKVRLYRVGQDEVAR